MIQCIGFNAVPVDILPHGLGRFEKGIEVCLQIEKKGHRPLVAASMSLLPHESSNCGHNPSFRKFNVNLQNFQT